MNNSRENLPDEDEVKHQIALRLAADEALRESEERWRYALEGAGDGVWDWDVLTDTVFLTPRCREIIGFEDGEIASNRHDWLARIHPDDMADCMRAMYDCLKGRAPVYASEHRVRCKDGRYIWLLDRARVISRSPDGRVLRMIGTHTDITARKATELAVLQSRQLLLTVIDKVPARIFWKDRDSAYLGCNAVFAQDAGKATPQQVIGLVDAQLPWAAQAATEREHDLKVMTTGQIRLHEESLRTTTDGQSHWLRTSKVPLRNPNHEVFGVLGIYEDITEHRQALAQVALAASVFSHSREGIMITDTGGSILDVNDAFTRITGYNRAEVLGKNPRLLSSGRQGESFYAALWGSLADKGHWYGEVWNRRKNGEVYAEMLNISAVRDAQGLAQHYVALFSDISLAKAHQKQLEHVAHFDALTGLPNRVLLADRLQQGMTQAQRRGQLLAVAFLDLDGFKGVNDAHGHEAGDQLLVALASRLKQALREGDTLSRMGGDEFVAVLVDLPDVASCEPLLSRLLLAAAQPVLWGGALLQVSASLGVTFFPQADDVDADQLLRQADQAMYQAKLAGKNRYHVFDAEQDRSLRGHHESVERMRLGLSAQEFVLYYQPKVNMRSGVVIGAEALIRWQHPQRGLLLPGEFLPLIEGHTLAVALGEWVIATALTQMTQWAAQGLVLPVSVNISARQLQQADFVERLTAILARYPALRPGLLELEVLETSALEDLAHVSQVIETCRTMGVNFALDDFGTGYSSLTYLKRLPVKLLKIDQSFVRDMLDDPDDLAILKGVVGLANAFGRDVIAEGVETVAHGARLLQLGCELAQGYGIARPMPAQALPGWVATWRPDPSWTATSLP
jgi:diguanylate cyclase (GGDEF)-like protein/PAS domain S-box-containing protein